MSGHPTHFWKTAPYTEEWAREAPGQYRRCVCGDIVHVDDVCENPVDLDVDGDYIECGSTEGQVIT